MAFSCEQMDDLITQLVDNELRNEDQKQTVAHLQQCGSCQKSYELQKALKKQLGTAVQQVAAPVHMRARIRRDIREFNSWPGFFGSLAHVFSAHKFKGAVAAISLVLLVALPYSQIMFDQTGTSSSGDQASMRFVAVKGKILCIDCEAIKAAGQVPVCAEDHHLGLKDESGEIWSFVNAAEGKKIIHDFSLMNQPLEVEGYALPGAFHNNISVQKYRKL